MGRRLAVITLAVVVAAVCVRLGFWQLDRLQQRRASNDRIRTGLGAASMVLGGAPGPGAAHRRASAIGMYDITGEVVLFGRSFEGRAGDHLLTPLRLPDGTALLVDRGWVPTGVRPPPADGVVRVEGFLLPPEPAVGGAPTSEQVIAVDPGEIERGLPYELAPVYLLLQEQSPPSGVLPRPAPLPELSEGPHLSYAIQWFSFAGVALAGGTVLFRREGRAGTAGAE